MKAGLANRLCDGARALSQFVLHFLHPKGIAIGFGRHASQRFEQPVKVICAQANVKGQIIELRLGNK